MVSPLPFPDWVPLWVHVVVLIALGTLALLFALMPFSLLGVKSRLEAIDLRLDELQNEVRSLALRLPERLSEPGRDPLGPPPIPPASVRSPSGRTEPRLY